MASELTILTNKLSLVYEYVHPKLIFNVSEKDVSRVKISWRRLGQEWPLMFHLQVAGAANLIRADVNSEPLSKEVEIIRLKHQSRGLAMVMAELQKLQGPASDGLLMAMIMVGVLTDPTDSRLPEIYRMSPLATAQHLHLYARLTIVPATIQALLDQVNQRGGIHKVKNYGMVEILQLLVLSISV